MTAEQRGSGYGRLARIGAVEASLIGAAGVGSVSASLVAAPRWIAAAGAGLAGLMLAIAVVDRRRLVIPDELNGLAFIAGLTAAGFRTETSAEAGILDSLLRAGVMFGLFFVFRAGYRGLRGREGMGLGDVKLAAVAGAWLDWVDLPIAVDIAALSALAAALIQRVRVVGFDPQAKLPFGAFFAPAIWICWLFAAWRGDWALS